MMRNGRAPLGLVGLVACLWGPTTGCGPITTTNNVAKARVAIAAAEASGADKTAVYEFVSAQAYLRKAREEEGFSDFQAAIDYAALSQEFAEKAKARADAKRAGAEGLEGSPMPTEMGDPGGMTTPVGPRKPKPKPKPDPNAPPSGSSL